MYTWACGEKHPSSSLSNVPALWSQPHLTGSYKKQQEKSSICFFPLRLHQTRIRETLCNMFALVPCPGRARGAQRWVLLSPCPSEGGPAASLAPTELHPSRSNQAERSRKEELDRPSKAMSCRQQLRDRDQIRICKSRWDEHKLTFFHAVILSHGQQRHIYSAPFILFLDRLPGLFCSVFPNFQQCRSPICN